MIQYAEKILLIQGGYSESTKRLGLRLPDFFLLTQKRSCQGRQEDYCEHYRCDAYFVGEVYVNVEERKNSH
jgi:hypothetical protein